MNPSLLIPLALVAVLVSPVRAQESALFKGGVNAASVKAVFGYTLPEGAVLGSEVWTVDDFYADSLFGAGAKQCVAASTPLSKAAEQENPSPYREFSSDAHVLARSGANAYQVYRFWVAGSAKGKNAKRTALGKLKIFQDNLAKAIEASQHCR